MTTAQKVQMVFRELQTQESRQELSLTFTRDVVLVMREMGWTVDYTMDLGITQFNQVKEALVYIYEQSKQPSQNSNVGAGTFR